MCDIVMIRTFEQEIIERFAGSSRVPVINGLTNEYHPCQVLADLFTVKEHIGGWEGKRIAWIGDGNNMANSWIEAAGILGLDLALACPPGHEPDAAIYARARATERGRITVTHTPAEAAAGRHVISTDVFASMGQEAEAETRLKTFAGFCIDRALMSVAAADAVVLHCLPAHRGEEISDEVIEGSQSLVWKQAENRLHSQKALLESLIG
jgi:ornithine carbamoyltransferase